MKHLKCSYCKKLLPQNKFSINRANTFRGGISYACLVCERKHRKIYLEKNPHIREKMNARKREYYATPESRRKQRGHYYKKRYGITLEKYGQMLKEQGGVCAICGERSNHKTQAHFHVDHDHVTGRVRGLLCIRCNTVIGNSREQTKILENAIKYLYRHLDET